MLSWIAGQADPILAAVSFVFAASLVPTVAHQWRARASTVPLSTSILTSAGLAVIATVYAALGLWLAVGVGSVTALLWAAIGFQRWWYGYGYGRTASPMRAPVARTVADYLSGAEAPWRAP